MTDETKAPKVDIFAEKTPAGAPAYPQMIYVETGEKHPNNAPIMKSIGVAKNPDEHKKMLDEHKKSASWGK